MNKLPTTKQLQYFLALVEEGHFGRAAQASFVSQSAFSNAIAEFEATLGAQLVDRTNRQVTITALGQDVAVQARLCLRDIEGLMELADQRAAPLSGELRLGVIPTIAPFLLPKLLPKIRKAYPDLKLLLVEDQTERIHERLLAGKLDVLLLALPVELRSVEELPLFNDRFYLACRENTRFVDPPNYRSNRLLDESVLLLEDGHCLRDHALAACRLKSTRTLSKISATSLLTLIEMVDADLGVTFLPAMAKGSTLLRNTKVKLYPLKENSHRQIGLAWRKGSARAQDFKLLGEIIASQQSGGS